MKTQLLFLTVLFFFANSVFAETCTINRNSTSNPAISWGFGDSTGSYGQSRHNPEICTYIPPGSTITNTTISFVSYAGGPDVLPTGLPWGEHTVLVTSGGRQALVSKGLYVDNVRHHSGSGSSSAFNGLDLSTLDFYVGASVPGSQETCASGVPSVCEDYMYFTYTLTFEYESGLVPWIITKGRAHLAYSDDSRKSKNKTYVVVVGHGEQTHNGVDATNWNYALSYDKVNKFFYGSSATPGYEWSNMAYGKYWVHVTPCNSHGCGEDTIYYAVDITDPLRIP